jgi:hypothetical protein
MTMSIRRGKPESFLSGRVAIAIFALMCCPAIGASNLQSTDASHQGDEDDPTRPINTIDLRLHYEDDTTTRQDDLQEAILRGNFRIDLDPHWRVGIRVDLPLLASNAVVDANPEGDFGFGVGRPLLLAFLARMVDERWAYGAGAKLTAPAASGDQFGSGNWEILPLAAVRAMLPEISEGSYIVPQFGYAQSFAQSFSSRRTSNLQFSPQLKIALPDSWFVDFYPTTDIRYNLGPKVGGQTGPLFLPMDVEVGRTIAKDIVGSLEVSVPIVKDYPVYHLKIEARFSYQL